LQEYLQAWGTSISHVLQEVAGAPHTWQELSPEAARAQLAKLKEEGLGVQFEATKHLSGNHGFVLSKRDAVRLAKLLLAEPEDGSAAMNDDHRDAVSELFRQFAGEAGRALKELAGGEVSFKWLGLDSFPGEPARQVGFQWSSPAREPFTLIAELSPALLTALAPATPPPSPTATQSPPPPNSASQGLQGVGGSLNGRPVPEAPSAGVGPPAGRSLNDPTVPAAPSAGAGSPAAAAFVLPTPTQPPAPSAPIRDPKLELLMDVELNATLRFGECQMTLRDVLDLTAGSVVELDQYVQDPVELLVGKKVIARGQVVVVEGNYGLRVMEIISPRERIESLRT
jgi:flagellar motor switch protein FliN/FliY